MKHTYYDGRRVIDWDQCVWRPGKKPAATSYLPEVQKRIRDMEQYNWMVREQERAMAKLRRLYGF